MKIAIRSIDNFDSTLYGPVIYINIRFRGPDTRDNTPWVVLYYMSYTINKHVGGEFEEIVDQTIEVLEEEGFGVLCDIDVQQTFAKKLDLDEEYRRYRILGACNPSLAYEGLEQELRLGALLPCNFIVYETDDGTVGVSAVDPEVLLDVVDNEELDDIANEVRERFERVMASLPETQTP